MEIATAGKLKVTGPYRLHIAAQRDWRSKRPETSTISSNPCPTPRGLGIDQDDSLAEEQSAKWADNLDGFAIVAIVIG